MLCNVTAGKGVLPFLSALAATTRDDDRFTLTIAGALDAEPEYAAACKSAIAGEALDHRVQLLSALSHPDALARLAEADLLVSASRMESYGMALAEARAAGVPILARAGGNAAAHVASSAGGELCADETQLAQRFLELVRDPRRAVSAPRARRCRHPHAQLGYRRPRARRAARSARLVTR